PADRRSAPRIGEQTAAPEVAVGRHIADIYSLAPARPRKMSPAATRAGTAYSAQIHTARTIGAQSTGVRRNPCQALNWVLRRYGCRAESPGRMSTSCRRSENISVPTMAAPLFRRAVDSSSAIEAIARIGSRYTSMLAPTRASPCGADTSVPERLVIGLKPEARTAATSATTPVIAIAAIA